MMGAAESISDLRSLLSIVAEETGALKMNDADEDSVGWTTEGPLPMTFGHVSRAHSALAALEVALSAAEPVASRYDFDGCGFRYIDNGSGSDWKTRHPDSELLYTTPPAPSVAVKEGQMINNMLLSQVLQNAFFAGRGTSGTVSREDMAAWQDYDPYHLEAFKRIRSALSAQVQDVADMPQSPWPASDWAIGRIKELEAQAVPEGWQLVPVEPTSEMEDAARHLMMWLDFSRPTEAALLAHCKRLGKEPPPECRDVDHVPPKAMRLFWVYRAMLAAAPAKQEG